MVALQHRETILAIDDSLRLRTGSPFLVVRAEYEPFIVAAGFLHERRKVILDRGVELLHTEDVEADVRYGLGHPLAAHRPIVAVVPQLTARTQKIVSTDAALDGSLFPRICHSGLLAGPARSQDKKSQ